jgi:hypothetical protein
MYFAGKWTGVPDITALFDCLCNERLSDCNRSMAILGNRRGLGSETVFSFLAIDKKTYRKYLQTFASGGRAALFGARPG